MQKEVVIVLAEDDFGHAALVQKNLKRSGITNGFIHFKDGEETLSFFLRRTQEPKFVSGTPYLLLLDIRMPKVDGMEVLKQLKGNGELKKMPVIMLTTTDDPRDIEKCHRLGCSSYIIKPVDYENFANAIRQLGLFLTVVTIPPIDGETQDD